MLATQIIPAAICDNTAASGLIAKGNKETRNDKK